MTDNELNFLTVSQCISSDYCKGYNEAIKKANELINRQKAEVEHLQEKIRKDREAVYCLLKKAKAENDKCIKENKNE